MTEAETPINTLELATELTIAWLQNPNTRASAEEVPAFLDTMHKSVANLFVAKTPDTDALVQDYTPATTVRKSLSSPDHIISMIDGQPYRTLRRHLATHGLTPDQYRERYGLKPDYPMVAPSYSETRRAMAIKIGLGRKSGAVEAASQSAEASDISATAEAAPRRRSRRAGN